MPLEREDLEGYFDILRDDIKRVEVGINYRLDQLNGKTNQNITDIAVMKATLETTKSSARNQGAGWGAGAGTFFGAVGMFIYEYFTK